MDEGIFAHQADPEAGGLRQKVFCGAAVGGAESRCIQSGTSMHCGRRRPHSSHRHRSPGRMEDPREDRGVVAAKPSQDAGTVAAALSGSLPLREVPGTAGPGCTYQAWRESWPDGDPAAAGSGSGPTCGRHRRGGRCGAAAAPGAAARRGLTRPPPAGRRKDLSHLVPLLESQNPQQRPSPAALQGDLVPTWNCWRC